MAPLLLGCLPTIGSSLLLMWLGFGSVLNLVYKDARSNPPARLPSRHEWSCFCSRLCQQLAQVSCSSLSGLAHGNPDQIHPARPSQPSRMILLMSLPSTGSRLCFLYGTYPAWSSLQTIVPCSLVVSCLVYGEARSNPLARQSEALCVVVSTFVQGSSLLLKSLRLSI